MPFQITDHVQGVNHVRQNQVALLNSQVYLSASKPETLYELWCVWLPVNCWSLMLDSEKIRPQLEYHIKRVEGIFFFLLKKKKILWDEQLRRGTGWFRKLKSMKCVFQMVAKLSVTMLDMKPSTSHLTTGKQRRKAPPTHTHTFQSHVRS